MANITLKGNPFNTSGNLPSAGSKAPDFTLTRNNLSDVTLDDYKGKKVVLNIVPSLDTPVCATSLRRFNTLASDLDQNAAILTVSNDIPFAQTRFCTAEGIDRAEALSQLRNRSFGTDYGVTIVDGPLAGLLARAVVVLDSGHNIAYTELVPEIAQEPNYDAALDALKTAN